MKLICLTSTAINIGRSENQSNSVMLVTKSVISWDHTVQTYKLISLLLEIFQCTYKIILICCLPWKNTCNLSIVQAELPHWVEVLLFSKISSYLAILLQRAFNNKSIFLLISKNLYPAIKLQGDTYLPLGWKTSQLQSACYFTIDSKKAQKSSDTTYI